MGKLTENELKVFENFYLLERHRKMIDLVIYMECTVEKSIEREYKDLLTDEVGSIMNKPFLNDFLLSARKSLKKYDSFFNKILSIDTTEKKTLEGVAEVVGEVTESLKVLSDELIVSVPKQLFNNRLDILGLDNNKNKFKTLERIIKNDKIINRRSMSENDVGQIQIVVIGILTYDDNIAVFTKKEISERNRFHNKNTVWIGGHLQNTDIDNDEDITVLKSMTNCLRREIEEEIHFQFDTTPTLQGLVYDKTHSKSLQHL